jgi:hypothetical protein
MKSEQPRKVNPDLEQSSLEATGGETREDREKSFSRRMMLWSLPAAAMGLAALSQSRASADPNGHYADHPYQDHWDGYTNNHMDYLDPAPRHVDDHIDHDDAEVHGDTHSDDVVYYHEDAHWDEWSSHFDSEKVDLYGDHQDHTDYEDAHYDHTDHLDDSHRDHTDHIDQHGDETRYADHDDI